MFAYLSIGPSNPEKINQSKHKSLLSKTTAKTIKASVRDLIIWIYAPTEGVRGENDGAAGRGRACDVGSEAPW
jgi:hypothetical protein